MFRCFILCISFHPWGKKKPGSHERVQPGSVLLLLNLLLGAVGIHDGGVLQMTLQVAGNGIDVDAAQLGALLQLLLGQTFGLVLDRKSVV